MVKEKSNSISNNFIEAVCKRLADNQQVRRALPVWGRVHIDRQLPFLCVYRQLNEEDHSLSERLVTVEASYLTASGNRSLHKPLALLVKNIARTLKESFGSFLIVEVWIMPEAESVGNLLPYQPVFKIIRPKKAALSSTIETLEKSLKKIKLHKQPAIVEVDIASKINPPSLPPIITPEELKQIGCHYIGIGVRPVYKNEVSLQVFPLIRRELMRKFAQALKNGFFQFTHTHTTHRPLHYQSLGRYSVVKAVWEVDRQLAETYNGFDFLLQVTPVNSDSAWTAFQKSRFERAPEFIYRPIPIDPSLAKRRLYRIPLERIEDPTLAQLFREQQLELDRKLTLLIDRGTPRFIYGSLQLYGIIDEPLLNQADSLLKQLSPRSRDESYSRSIDAQTFAVRARQEMDYFRKKFPKINNKVLVREDITGLMVSQGNLLIGKQLKIPETRIEALIQHEVGTHFLTYLNGKAQPFRQLYIGLAGYEELQEGLAVFSEYLVGGLTRPRLRLLAARVLAAHRMVQGASFVEIFRELNKIHGFERRTAFTITMRTFRGGGLTKDAIYLRGLIQLLEYLKNGGALEPLFIGKIAVNHVAIIQELQWRKVLHPTPQLPRYLSDQKTVDNLNNIRNGLSLINMIKRRKHEDRICS